MTVFDDILPRNALEAARVRRTGAWAGDVYKAVKVIARNRPDLVVVLINTGRLVSDRGGRRRVVGCLQEVYSSEVPYLEAQDPQRPPQEYMSRSAAVDPDTRVACPSVVRW